MKATPQRLAFVWIFAMRINRATVWIARPNWLANWVNVAPIITLAALPVAVLMRLWM